ncbi:MAG: hypothetical protein ACI9G1_003592, partial [Pirellulaceae bacterium]
SGGIATANDCKSTAELIEFADKALYEAKSAGRNLVYKYDGGELLPVDVETVGVETDDVETDGVETDDVEPANLQPAESGTVAADS